VTALVPARWRRRAPALVALGTTWMLAWSLLEEGSDGPVVFDGPVDGALHRLQPPLGSIAGTFAGMSSAVHFGLLLLVLLALCRLARSTRAAVALVVALGAELLATETLKYVVAATTPLGGATFPSGHTATAAVIAVVIGLLASGGGPLARRVDGRLLLAVTVLAWLSVVAVGASMVIIDAHSASDVVAAGPFGAAVGLAVAVGTDRWWPASQSNEARADTAG
jgi:membrane-associated phospholipid phosphatase